MLKSEVVQLLGLVKGCWQDQIADEMTAAVWFEVLNQMNFETTKAAVMDMTKAGRDRPTVGQIYAAALELERQKRLALMPPQKVRTSIPGTRFCTPSGVYLIADVDGHVRRMAEQERQDDRGTSQRIRAAAVERTKANAQA